ncbi:hypothetical protein M1446_03470 [Candidatus Dependentiae bacterium]|nr:hypothetical protein [Candidatus Dependentiae bacterium]
MNRIISNITILVLVVSNISCAGLKFRSIINKSSHDIAFFIKPLKESEEKQEIVVAKHSSTDISQYSFMTTEGPKKGYIFTFKNEKPYKELCFEYFGLCLNDEIEINPSSSPDYTLLVYIDGKLYKRVTATMEQKGFLDIVLLPKGRVKLEGDINTHNVDNVKYAKLLNDEICC